uniref:Proteasome subunit beta n=1 Tax=Chromera velia CCMP2878 TaxID=1169474 RepID=A0A0G4I119_9ALVE|mmetsp:Transcript_55081/g.107709  ORF Transcript_55081/g.107709 Transcript_55081/m.107709 type:complete len:275 (-) Transcript_55081:174-998(-)|eukprot:Cvel_8.t1-p1 / transcript=Cvel_8.t1 / gene=Cvel_8 / organism=Chromera_velia_CCMP2878 / gene_product=Proteasome subunit beta type-7, putative / transcript_product=Proteasome subunit beta type-7, putative / location=Cvel_scaffold5:51716-54737(-) / protein_length=274 / sequence_SO=supercontig / SO=protein_coding / is_pseudo=false
MDYVDAINVQRSGFSFDAVRRNEMLLQNGLKPFKAMKTGTTICGVVCKDAVVLAADTRATEGPIVADKEADKIHYLADNIFCAGAGTSADLTHVTEMMASQLELHRLYVDRQPRVTTAVAMLTQMLFRYQGHIGTALVLGGHDVKGPHLFMIHPHGSSDRLPFATMGSGSLAAMAVLEAGYKDDMTAEEGQKLVADAIRSGIDNDLGSGGNIDTCIIKKEGVTHTVGFERGNERKFRMPMKVEFPKGTTPTLEEHVREMRAKITIEDGDVTMGV